MKQYRKRPVVIEAAQHDGSETSALEILRWMRGSEPVTNKAQIGACWGDRKNDHPEDVWFLFIRTRDGLMEAAPGDWVIQEPFPTEDRRFYPCKPDIFERTYEAVDEPHAPELEEIPEGWRSLLHDPPPFDLDPNADNVTLRSIGGRFYWLDDDYEILTHGRHCRCSPCAQEDWTNPALAPCGMHGPSCPRAYDPRGRAGEAVRRPT